MTQDNPTPPPSEASTPPGTPVDYASPASVAPGVDEGNRTNAALCHYLNIVWLVPLILYLTKKDESPLIKQEGGEALNFTLTCLIAHVICAITACFVIPAILMFVIMILQIVFGIIGGNKVRAGESYQYPWRIQFIK